MVVEEIDREDGRDERVTVMQPEYVDRQLGTARPVCTECGEPFERDSGELAARRGTGMLPSSRCPACRLARRE